ncbi:MAG TPA: hypothetical protein VFU95_02740 [Telluria sp.]|nr:hypothetical protein [Telluria sp.]
MAVSAARETPSHRRRRAGIEPHRRARILELRVLQKNSGTLLKEINSVAKKGPGQVMPFSEGDIWQT